MQTLRRLYPGAFALSLALNVYFLFPYARHLAPDDLGPEGTTYSLSSAAAEAALSSLSLPSDEPVATTRAPRDGCALEVYADPLYSTVEVDGRDRGPGPTLVTGPCGSAVNVTLRSSGYRNRVMSVVLKYRLGKMVAQLERDPL